MANLENVSQVKQLTKVDNTHGHKYDGRLSFEGYAICSLCGCCENTNEAASSCLKRQEADEVLPLLSNK